MSHTADYEKHRLVYQWLEKGFYTFVPFMSPIVRQTKAIFNQSVYIRYLKLKASSLTLMLFSNFSGILISLSPVQSTWHSNSHGLNIRNGESPCFQTALTYRIKTIFLALIESTDVVIRYYLNSIQYIFSFGCICIRLEIAFCEF